MFLEIVRRTVWALFRLENEQLRNTEVMNCFIELIIYWLNSRTRYLSFQGYRKVNFVPLHFDRTPERLQTNVFLKSSLYIIVTHNFINAGALQGKNVVYEVVSFGVAVVSIGAFVIVLSSSRYH